MQGILWTLNEKIPVEGLRLDLTKKEIELPDGESVKNVK